MNLVLIGEERRRVVTSAHELPAGLELVEVSDCRGGRSRCQLRLVVRSDSSGECLVAAGVITAAQLKSLPPCGIRSFDKRFGAPSEREPLGQFTRVSVYKRKTIMRARILLYGDNPELARYCSWAHLPAHRGRPVLTLVVNK